MKSIFIFLVRVYQIFVSPILGPKCRFYPTCSHYCLHCLEKLPIHRALWYSGKRILKCHPFHPGGVDPAPEK